MGFASAFFLAALLVPFANTDSNKPETKRPSLIERGFYMNCPAGKIETQEYRDHVRFYRGSEQTPFAIYREGSLEYSSKNDGRMDKKMNINSAFVSTEPCQILKKLNQRK